MRCHKITATQPGSQHPLRVRYAASEAEARVARATLMEELDLPKKQITVEPCEVPTGKEDLLHYLNSAMLVFDLSKPQDR